MLKENAHSSAVVVKSLASLLPELHKYFLWSLSMLRTSEQLSLDYPPADSKFPPSVLIRKKCVFDYS